MQGAGPAGVREQYHARLLDMVEDGVVGTDDSFRITQWNLGAERLDGYTAAKVLGLPATGVPSRRMAVSSCRARPLSRSSRQVYERGSPSGVTATTATPIAQHLCDGQRRLV